MAVPHGDRSMRTRRRTATPCSSGTHMYLTVRSPGRAGRTWPVLLEQWFPSLPFQVQRGEVGISAGCPVGVGLLVVPRGHLSLRYWSHERLGVCQERPPKIADRSSLSTRHFADSTVCGCSGIMCAGVGHHRCSPECGRPRMQCIGGSVEGYLFDGSRYGGVGEHVVTTCQGPAAASVFAGLVIPPRTVIEKYP